MVFSTSPGSVDFSPVPHIVTSTEPLQQHHHYHHHHQQQQHQQHPYHLPHHLECSRPRQPGGDPLGATTCLVCPRTAPAILCPGVPCSLGPRVAAVPGPLTPSNIHPVASAANHYTQELTSSLWNSGGEKPLVSPVLLLFSFVTFFLSNFCIPFISVC